MGYKDENQEKESFWKDPLPPSPSHTHTPYHKNNCIIMKNHTIQFKLSQILYLKKKQQPSENILYT